MEYWSSWLTTVRACNLQSCAWHNAELL